MRLKTPKTQANPTTSFARRLRLLFIARPLSKKRQGHIGMAAFSGVEGFLHLRAERGGPRTRSRCGVISRRQALVGMTRRRPNTIRVDSRLLTPSPCNAGQVKSRNRTVRENLARLGKVPEPAAGLTLVEISDMDP